MKFNSMQVKEKYEKLAKWYDLFEGPQLAVVGVNRMRKKLLGIAFGKTLEIGAGTGINFKYYPRPIELTAIDISPKMLDLANTRARKLNLKVDFRIMDAQSLEFPDDSFDTVVSTLSLSTFPNPIKAIKEMARVCRQDGKILLLEHGRSSNEWIGKFQDQRAEKHFKFLGSIWNRQPLRLSRIAGLKILKNEDYFFGIFNLIEASPSK